MRLIIDVGGTKTLVVATDKGGSQLAKLKFPTDKNFNEFVKHLISEIRALIEPLPHPLEAIAIAMPGTVDYNTNLVLRMGHENWTNVDIFHPLNEVFSVPVFLHNDVNMATIGESRSGAGKGYAICLYLTISTGIGAGVAENGQIVPAFAQYEPWRNSVIYEGKAYTWDKLASGSAFVDAYGKLGKDVPLESPVWQEYAKKIAIGLKPVLTECQPDIVVIGGSMGVHVAKYHDALVKELATDLPVVSARNPDEAVINGGIEVLREKLNK